MSRIGSRPIELGDDVSVDIAADNTVTISGPKGELSEQIDPRLNLTQEDHTLVLTRPSDSKEHRSQHGLFRALLGNMVEGVTEGFKKALEIRGIGYRANIKNGALELELGYSHPIYFLPPEGIDLSVEEGGRNEYTKIIVEGIDKQLVGQVASKIRSLRPPEPYKGKGVRYVGEHVERKAGKTAAAAAQ